MEIEKLLADILNKDVWENNDKMNIKLYVKTKVKKALEEVYYNGFEKGEKLNK